MSREIALDTINLKPTDRYGHTDYSLEYHKEYIFKKTGLRPNQPNALRKYYDACNIDFLFGTNDGLYGDWQNFGRSTDMGHAVYAEDGSDMRMIAPCPFNKAEEVWAFDAVEEYGLPSFDEQVKSYEDIIVKSKELYPNQLYTGGYYKSIMSGAIQAFGWEMLLIGASNLSKMEKVLDGFYRRTKYHMEAWANTSAQVIIQHDDFVWTSGPFLKPDYYRQVIIPRYKELWKPLHKAGKKVLFISDGNFTEFAEDIVEAGADGLIFEPCMDFGYMADHFGSSTALIGSYVDCRDLTFNKWDKVKSDMDKTFEVAKRCRGLIFAVGNHLPANITDEMMDLYLDYLEDHLDK